MTTNKEKGFPIKRVVDVEFLSAKQIAEAIGNKADLPLEDVKVDGKQLELKILQTDDDAKLAESLHGSLSVVRDLKPDLLNDHGFWTWLGLYPLRDHVITRWCGGYENGWPKNPSRCSYFLTGDGVHAQSRCAPRRLYIAALTSQRAEGDYSRIPLVLKTADIFSTIFERKLGLDPELAVEMLLQFDPIRSDRRKYRTAAKLLGLILATVCLEDLDREEKKQLVADAIDEVSLQLIDTE